MNTYEIFDIHKSLLDDRAVVEARTAKEAVTKYLQPSASQQVQRGSWGHIVVTKFIERDGRRYKRGHTLVFGLIEG